MGEAKSKGKWVKLIQAIAYELKPFDLPSKDSVLHAAKNVLQLAKALLRIAYLVLIFLVDFSRNNAIASLKICIWTIGLYATSHLNFGTIYCLGTGFYLVFTNLGDKKPGEASAYSVFNNGCQALLGSLTADQLLSQILHYNVNQNNGIQEHGEDDQNRAPGMLRRQGQREGQGNPNAGAANREAEEKKEETPKRNGSRKSGKKARRKYEQRLERRRMMEAQQQAEAEGGLFYYDSDDGHQ